MAYTLEEFCADCRAALLQSKGEQARETIRANLERLLANEAFVAAYCGPDAEAGRHTLFHDPETDVHVLAHIYDAGRTSPPHDHGPSWAAYGQAAQYTDMSEYDKTGEVGADGREVVVKRRQYRLDPGMAGVFGPGQVHSIHFPDKARFVRVTGTDLDQVTTHTFALAPAEA